MTYVGADGQSYPEVAARAVQSIHPQHQSPYYGYIRSGIKQKIYLFPTLEDTRAWFGQHVQLQPDHDYAAAFAATDLRVPIAGMEHFMRANVSGDHVGQWWPFFLGLPLGGLGGYALRRWQEPPATRQQVPPLRDVVRPLVTPTPGPKTAGDPYVGGPWLDLAGQDYGYGGYSDGYGDSYVGGPWHDIAGPSVGGPWHDIVGPSVGGPWHDIAGPSVGGPWLDIVGAQTDDVARRRSWPQTKALIQSAIDDVTREAASYPAEAYVWTLDAPTSAPYAGREGSIVTLEGTTSVVPFSSQGEALKYLREVAQTRPVALAMFERSSPHWPNPVAWRKSDDPGHEQVIAQHVASKQPTQTSGAYVGAETAKSALAAVRERAQSLAAKRAGNVIGVIHTAKDGLWHTLAFRSGDDADDWLGTATHDPASYTYAAYYDKEDFQWPHPVNEKIGGRRIPSRREPIRREIATTSGDFIGADIDDYRTRAKQLATLKPGNAVGVLLTPDGLWHRFAFTSLDDTIDWLQTTTQKDKSSFTYAAAFEKGRDGTAYMQDEEVGRARTPSRPGEPIRREIATAG